MSQTIYIINLFLFLLLIVYSRHIQAEITDAPSFVLASSYDPKVGTVDAPTTPGGACLNDEDYAGNWKAAGKDGKTGFDNFPFDMQRCNENCKDLLIFGAVSVEYGCGGFLQPSCSDDIFAICVGDCMAQKPGSPKLRTQKGYTPPCAACMGQISQCVTRLCLSSCVMGQESEECRRCSEGNCNIEFQQCAGINVNLKQRAPMDLTPIVIGSVAGGVLLLVSVSILGYRYRLKTRKHQRLSMAELAMLAKQTSFVPENSIPVGLASQLKSKQSLAPSTSPWQPSQGSNLTAYRSQYEAQQRANMTGVAPQKPSPSERMSLLVRDPLNKITPNKVPLTLLWTFEAERVDELSVQAGDKVLGIEQKDGWWLASHNGRIGLVPVSYVVHDNTAAVAPGGKSGQANHTKSIRMSALHTALTPEKIALMPAVPVIVRFDFKAEEPDELSVTKGAVLLQIDDQDGWSLVRMQNSTHFGLVPSNHLGAIVSSPSNLRSEAHQQGQLESISDDPDF